LGSSWHGIKIDARIRALGEPNSYRPGSEPVSREIHDRRVDHRSSDGGEAYGRLRLGHQDFMVDDYARPAGRDAACCLSFERLQPVVRTSPAVASWLYAA
jgi:hypothetical protein